MLGTGGTKMNKTPIYCPQKFSGMEGMGIDRERGGMEKGREKKHSYREREEEREMKTVNQKVWGKW